MKKFWDREKKQDLVFLTAQNDEKEIASFVEKEAEKRKEARLSYELQWRLNTNYLNGNQHCDINVHRMTVENYRPLYDYMSNEVYNRIAPIMETRMAYLLEENFSPEVRPKGQRIADKQIAKKATELLRQMLEGATYKSTFNRILGLCELYGNAFELVWWDEKRKTVDYTALSPFEVLPQELSLEEIGEQPSIILEQIKNVGEIEERYGVKVKGGKVSSYGVMPVAGTGGLGYEGAAEAFLPIEKEDSVLLHTYMEKPTAAFPEGRLIICAADKVFHNGVLPDGKYPLCHYRSKRISGHFYGKSVIETLIPLQRTYNGIKNRINDFINRSSIGQLLIEDGSVDADDLCEKGLVPGEPVVYRRGAQLPTLVEQPILTAMAETQLKQTAQDMEYVSGVSGLMTDLTLPGGVTSGSAIENLLSIDAKRIKSYAENIRLAVCGFARMVLENLSAYGKSDPGSSFLDDCGEVVITKEEESINEDEQRARYEELLDKIDSAEKDDRWGQYLRCKLLRKIAGKEFMEASEEELQVGNAEEENEAFERGEALSVMPIDDDELHLHVHRSYILGSSFRILYAEEPEEAEKMLAHIAEHEEKMKKQKEEGFYA